MPVGDSDLPVFFADFGVPVQFMSQVVMANLDQPIDPFGGEGGPSRMESQRFTVSLPYNAWIVKPVPGNYVLISGQIYSVLGRSQSEDGKILMLELRKQWS